MRAILESRARPGTRLPSSRKLALTLGLSRMTVTLVYQELVSLGYLETRPRSGLAVAATVPVVTVILYVAAVEVPAAFETVIV